MNRTMAARRPPLKANARVAIGKAARGPTERTKWKPDAAPAGTTGYMTELRGWRRGEGVEPSGERNARQAGFEDR